MFYVLIIEVAVTGVAAFGAVLNVRTKVPSRRPRAAQAKESTSATAGNVALESPPKLKAVVFSLLAAGGILMPAGYLAYVGFFPGLFNTFTSKYYWIDAGLEWDWPGQDIASSFAIVGSNEEEVGPKYTVAGDSTCDEGKAGYVAVCWNNKLKNSGYPPNVRTDIPVGAAPTHWCTYKKDVLPKTIRDKKIEFGGNPGRTFFCGKAVGR